MNKTELKKILEAEGYYLGRCIEQLALHAPELIGDERADAALMW